MGKYCVNCGKELHTGARFCAKCGAAVLDAPAKLAPVVQPKPVPAAQTFTPPPSAPPVQSTYTTPPQYAPQPQYAPPIQHARTRRRGKNANNALCIVLSVLLVIQIAAVALYGWPGFMVNDRPQRLSGTQTGNGWGGQTAEPVLTRLSPAEVMEVSLARLLERLSDEGVSGGLNLNAAFGIPENIFSYNSAELELTMELDDSQMVYGQRSMLAKNGDAEHSMRLSGDGETYNMGAYFQGGDMIVQIADASYPMIRYTLPAEDATALSGLAAMERYQLCLRADDPAQGVNMDWTSALSGAGDTFAAHEGEIVVIPESVTAGDNSFEAEVSSLTLSEGEAAQTFAALIGGWQQDFRCRDMLSMIDLVLQEDDDQTAMEQMTALTADGQEAKLSLKTGSYQDQPALFELTYACVAGECALSLVFWEEGEDSYTSLELRLPSGDSFVYVDTAFAASNSTAHTFYAADGAVLAESLLSSIGSGDGNNFSSEFTYSMTDYTDEDEPQGETMSSSGSYSHSVSGKTINGSFSGQLLMSDDRDAKATAFSGTVTLSEDYGQPMIPEFIEGSGKTVANRLELFAAFIPEPEEDEEALEPGEMMQRLDSLPPLMQTLSANMLLFGM